MLTCTLLLVLAQAAPGTPGTSATPATTGASEDVPRAWPSADRAMRSDPRWLGGDAAFTIDLGDDRILWLFGDSFIGDGTTRDRGRAAFVRNSAAIQVGRDPETARLAFSWRVEDGRPGDLLRGDDETWRWPAHGLSDGGVLTLFAWRLREIDRSAFGFEAVGWEALRVEDTTGPPATWTISPLEGFETAFPVVLGSAVVAHDQHVYVYAVSEPGNHDAYLLRYARDAFSSGELASPEWFDDGAWVAHDATLSAPAPVFANAQTEFSVHRATDGRFVQVQSQGFGSTTVVARTAPAPEGPWSDPIELARPDESELPEVLVYAAKAHPELRGAELVVTYATNTTDLARLVADHGLYYPRFLRLSLPDSR